MLSMKITEESWKKKKAFRISRGIMDVSEVIVVELSDGVYRGFGECSPTDHYGESMASVLAQLKSIRYAVAGGVSRKEIQELLPAGAARNALDCAYWDFEAKKSGVPAWKTAGISEPRPIQTAYTLSLESPEEMAEIARQEACRGLLKLKLGDDDDIARVEAVRAAAPDVRVIVDANEAWTMGKLRTYAPELMRLGVTLIEQPLPAEHDEELEGYVSPVPLCADESCHVAADVEQVSKRYQFANIKLDKTGGLTEALELVRRAQAAGLRLMVGCMGGTSLAMAPGLIVASYCEVVDLDAPLLQSEDREHALRYDGGIIHPASGELWG